MHSAEHLSQFQIRKLQSVGLEGSEETGADLRLKPRLKKKNNLLEDSLKYIYLFIWLLLVS